MARSARSPRLSVVMPVYNAERYLQSALDSLLGQSFTDFEIIAVYDRSRDRSLAVLEACRDKRLVRIKQDISGGLVAALNVGVAAARGELLARMDADDVSLPERFARQVAYLDEHADIGVVAARCVFMDDAGAELRSPFPERGMAHTEIAWKLLLENPIVHPTVMTRTALLREAGAYPIDHPNAEDLALWIRLMSRTHLSVLPDILLRLRKHESNTTFAHWDKHLAGTVEVVRQTLEMLSGSPVSTDAAAHVLGLEPASQSLADVAAAATAMVGAYATIVARWPVMHADPAAMRMVGELLDRLGVLQRRGLPRAAMRRLLWRLATKNPAILGTRPGQRAVVRALGAQWLLDLRAAHRGASA